MADKESAKEDSSEYDECEEVAFDPYEGNVITTPVTSIGHAKKGNEK